jgi:predicted neuraminidase
MPVNTPAAHASFLLVDEGKLRAFWFAGTRESAPDVQIVSSAYAHGVWSKPLMVVNRHTAADALGFGGWIRRLGNPVAWIDGQGRTHLYVVATGLGGWAASRILHLRQDSNDKAFQPMGFLQLSPFFNFSTLIRSAPIPLTDGGVLLPAYFEMGVKYPLAIRLNANGDVVQSASSVIRMAGDLASLQPTVVVHSEKNAIAYLRDNSSEQQLKTVRTTDGGHSWQNIKPMKADAQGVSVPAMTNPDSGIAALRLLDGSTLLVRNPDPTGRQRLVMERSMDGLTHWQLLATLEDGRQTQSEYSYPSAVVIGSELHISYTYQRRWIRHVVFELQS